MTESLRPLPDIIKEGLQILFVGTSPGVRSSKIGHYFAGHSNVFWKLLYESKLTGRQLKTEEDNDMRDYCYGLTDIVKQPHPECDRYQKTIHNTKQTTTKPYFEYDIAKNSCLCWENEF